MNKIVKLLTKNGQVAKKLRKKKGDGKFIVEIVLMIVGVTLCVIYKGQIVTFVTNMITSLTNYAQSIFTSVKVS